jgi:hypothetical protein
VAVLAAAVTAALAVLAAAVTAALAVLAAAVTAALAVLYFVSYTRCDLILYVNVKPPS